AHHLPSFPTRRSSDLESLTLLSAAAKSMKLETRTVNARRQRWTREHEDYVAALRAEREKAQNGSAIDPLSLLGVLGEMMPADTRSEEHTLNSSHLVIS